MKLNAVDSMKFKKLQRRLGVPRVVVVGTLELLWMATAKNARRGDIGRFSNEEIAIECDWEGDPDQLVESLVETGWVDRSENYRLVIHDWHDHAPGFIKAWITNQNTTFATAENTVSGESTRDGPRASSSDEPRDGPLDEPRDGPSARANQAKPIQAHSSQSNSSQSKPCRPRSDLVFVWGEVQERLRSVGVASFHKTTMAAQENGYTPGQAMELIDHWSAIRDQYERAGKPNPRPLVARLTRVSPKTPTEQGWAPPGHRGGGGGASLMAQIRRLEEQEANP